MHDRKLKTSIISHMEMKKSTVQALFLYSLQAECEPGKIPNEMPGIAGTRL